MFAEVVVLIFKQVVHLTLLLALFLKMYVTINKAKLASKFAELVLKVAKKKPPALSCLPSFPLAQTKTLPVSPLAKEDGSWHRNGYRIKHILMMHNIPTLLRGKVFEVVLEFRGAVKGAEEIGTSGE